VKLTLPEKLIDQLVGVITGNSRKSPYRSGPELVDFFNQFGANDLYGSGFPSRHVYCRDKLSQFNGTETMERIVCLAFDFFDPLFNSENEAFQFNKSFSSLGFRLALDHAQGWMHGGEYIEGEPFFKIVDAGRPTIAPPAFLPNGNSLSEHTEKARRRIVDQDYSGAITSSYTLIEEFLKLSLREDNIEFKESEGDIRKLYKLLATSRGLDADANTPEPLKPMLSGLSVLISGFFEMANKMGDRHAPTYKASAHHARLTVNLAYSFCEFLLESREHQKRSNSKTAN
jgi:hypothetical protein